MARQMHYKTLYVSQQFFAKQRRELKSLHSAYLRQREPRRQRGLLESDALSSHIKLKKILTQLGRLNTSYHLRNL